MIEVSTPEPSSANPEQVSTPSYVTQRGEDRSQPVYAADGRAHLSTPGILTYGFGTTAAMWVGAYMLHIPFASGEATWELSMLAFVALVFVFVVGCYRAGQTMSPGWGAGMATGTLTSLLNLIVLASLLGGRTPEEVRTYMLPVVLGSVALGAIVGAVAGLLGARRPRTIDSARDLVPAPRSAGKSFASVVGETSLQPVSHLQRNWRGPLSKVAALTVLAMLGIGGAVTGMEEGLSVPDWPETEGYLMIFYPLSKMTGGIYYEHSHRLFGLLVGSVIAAMGFYLLWSDRRGWVRAVAVSVMALVIVQAILGGLRVTMSPDAGANAQQWAEAARARGGISTQDIDMVFAIAHGVFGQLLFAGVLLLAAATHSHWLQPTAPVFDRSARLQQQLGVVLIALLVVQIVLGAVLRHVGYTAALHGHIFLGVAVALIAIVYGMRAIATYRQSPQLHKLGKLLLIHALAIVPFGFLAWAVGGGQANRGEIEAIEVVVTTFHQLLGALVLGATVLLTCWSYRLVRDPHEVSPQP